MKKRFAGLGIIALIISSYLFVSSSRYSGQKNMEVLAAPEPLWPYECVDTMKTSRDKARSWQDSDALNNHIESQMQAIVDMGGNCVALDTPYDEEFLPHLKKWVSAARSHDLHIWYRGNFSSWEGWFGYPSGMTADEHVRRTTQFIIENSDLFEDGDIFTPSPEAENGGPFNQVEPDEYEAFRAYLMREHTEAQKAFEMINKKVTTNWLSMNGGLARRMLDQETADGLSNVVSLDHYIKTPEEMGEYIDYFSENLKSRVVIGEWGAPIPQINGTMDESEQAQFIESLLWEMYIQRKHIDGINYWVLYDGSTSLTEQNGEYREAMYEIQNYFKPGSIEGIVKNELDDPLHNVRIKLQRGGEEVLTDEKGVFIIPVPAGEHELTFQHEDYKEKRRTVKVAQHQVLTEQLTLKAIDHSWWKRIKMELQTWGR
ncbi:MAG: carboxypeptidase-like regulatory domain-containing protein [Candidatus Roizmanbacteria bacterium]|nr:carboxypeptidase-like regulatory domain-containing protein [Candidatus Roizmanbacteria bacterium]